MLSGGRKRRPIETTHALIYSPTDKSLCNSIANTIRSYLKAIQNGFTTEVLRNRRYAHKSFLINLQENFYRERIIRQPS